MHQQLRALLGVYPLVAVIGGAIGFASGSSSRGERTVIGLTVGFFAGFFLLHLVSVAIGIRRPSAPPRPASTPREVSADHAPEGSES
ncbi:MAG: hypothetical protein ACYDAQ_11145 [Mycobacteriales bacterium]